MTKLSRTIVIGAGSIIFALTGGASVVTAHDGEPSMSRNEVSRVSEAALAATGGGRVTDTEIPDEESYYEVEVTLPSGRKVDVQLDASFRPMEKLPDVANS